jgi:putative PIN family toxin of toxin-antitoxin system
MRVVLDTNVLIAALISRGSCAELLEHCVHRHEVVVSEFIFGELREKLLGKLKYDAHDVDDAVALLRSAMRIVTPVQLDASVCRDRDDDSILGTAIAGDVDCIVTGDADLLVLGAYRGISIVRPADFLVIESSGE